MTYVGLCCRSQEETTDVSFAFRVLDDSAQVLRVLLDFHRPCEWSTGVRIRVEMMAGRWRCGGWFPFLTRRALVGK